MTSLQKRIIPIILPFALFAIGTNSQIVVSTTYPSTQEMNEEEDLMGLIYSKSSPSLAVVANGEPHGRSRNWTSDGYPKQESLRRCGPPRYLCTCLAEVEHPHLVICLGRPIFTFMH